MAYRDVKEKLGKIDLMKSNEYSLPDNNAAEDKKPKKAEEYDSYAMRNKDVDRIKGVYLGEDKMYTGDPWVDMGIAAGRAYRAKAGERLSNKADRQSKRGDRQAKRSSKK